MQTTKKQGFWTQVMNLAIPVAAQGILYAVLGIVNQLMVGTLGDTAVVAVSQSGRLFGILGFAQGGLTAGLGILAAQHVGNDDRDNIAPLQGMMLAGNLVLSLIFASVAWFAAPQLMAAFTNDPKVAAIGIQCLHVMGWSFLPVGFIGVYATTLRADGIVKFPLYISLATVPLEAILNFGFVEGNLGFPKLGAVGTTYSALISITLEAVVMLTIVYARRLTGNFGLRQMFNFHGKAQELRQLWRLTLPLLGDNLSFIISDTVVGAFYGFLGTGETVAVSLMLPIQMILITFFGGFSTATSVMVGQSLGADDMTGAWRTGKRLIYLALAAPLVIGLLLLIPMPWYIGLYHLTARSTSLTMAVMLAMALFIPFKVTNMVLGSILGAGGETKFIFYMSILGGWGLAVPIGAITTFALHWDVIWVFVAVTAEEVVRVGLGTWKMRQKTWLTNLVGKSQNV